MIDNYQGEVIDLNYILLKVCASLYKRVRTVDRNRNEHDHVFMSLQLLPFVGSLGREVIMHQHVNASTLLSSTNMNIKRIQTVKT